MAKLTIKMKREGVKVTSDREQVAVAVKTYRLRQGLTQARLGELWGVSRWTIMRIEAAEAVAWETSYRIFARLANDLQKEGVEPVEIAEE